MWMNRRRFMILAVALVALNIFFWLAAGGIAGPRAIINSFFGNSLIRGEVVVSSPTGVQDWRIDRGVITAIAGSAFTLRERDGTIVTIDVSPTARVQGPGKYSIVGRLKPRLRVVLYRQANQPAELVQVEGAGG
jgi:hypothetical protein